MGSRRTLLLAGLLALGGVASGCESAGESHACTPGETQLCLCLDGDSGVQVCAESGQAWETCTCGGSSGVGGGGGDGNGGGGSDTGGSDGTDGSGGGGSSGDDDCVSQDDYASKVCFEDAVFWADECGHKKELAESCATPQEACVDGACEIVCAPHAYLGCDNDSVWWFDACENKEEFVETCTGNDLCSQGECIEVCAPKAYEGCNDSDIWWFDSCDNPESLSEACEPQEFCANETCVKPFYDGTWKVTADPDTKDTGLGSATYNPTTIDLEVSGVDVTGLFNAFGTDVTFTGTIDGKDMNLVGEYKDPGGSDHTETWTVTFTALDQFEGVISDSFGIGGLPLGTLVWNITGVKQ